MASPGQGEPAVTYELRLDERLTATRESAEAAGRTVIAVGWDGAISGLLVVADTVKPTSGQAVAELEALGLRPILVPRSAGRPRAFFGDVMGHGVLPHSLVSQ